MFQTVSLFSSRRFSLCTQQWHMSYTFADSLQAGSGCSIQILLASCQQTCMTYTIAVYTAKNFWWWTEELSETCRVSSQNKFEKLVHLIGFIIGNLSRCTVTWTSVPGTYKLINGLFFPYIARNLLTIWRKVGFTGRTLVNGFGFVTLTERCGWECWEGVDGIYDLK
jgi:hypothetical protein